MELALNILAVFVFLALTYLCSRNRKDIRWRTVISLLVLNIIAALFFLKSGIGRDLIVICANGFNKVVSIAFEGVKVISPDLVPSDPSKMSFFVGALMPILLIVPLFDILTYFGILPFIVRYIGKILSIITGVPKFESFFSIEMMFLGNLEVLAVSRLQIDQNRSERNLTLAMMSMSCVSAALVSAYMSLMPAQYVLTAIPLNVVNVLVITSMLNPVKLEPGEDVIASYKNMEKPPFFAFLGESIANSGKLVLIIAATVVTFVSFVSLINQGLQLINENLTLMSILGIIFYPFVWIMGISGDEAFAMGQLMGTKIVTNEFVAMFSVKDTIDTFSPHFRCVATVFVTSFANFGTVGMVIGFFSGLGNNEKFSIIFKNVSYLLLSGVMVSLMSASIAGLFVW